MQQDVRKKQSKKDLRNTRVYAPTHPSSVNAPKNEKGNASKLNADAKQTNRRNEETDRESYVYMTDRQWKAIIKQDKRSPKDARDQARKQAADNITKKQSEQKVKKSPVAKDSASSSEKRPRKDEGKRAYTGIHRLEAVDEVFLGKREKVPQELPEKEKKQKKKRAPMNKRKLTTLLIFAVLLIGALTSGYFVFLLEKIEIEGAGQYASNSIRELSGLAIGRHMLLNNLERAKSNIETDPYLKVVNIVREFPRTIRISLSVRQEEAAIVSQGFYGIVDIEGHVLSIGSGGELSSLIRVLGMSQHGFQVNRSIGSADDVQAQTLKALLKELDALSLLQDVTEIDIANPLRVMLRTSEGVSVLLGQASQLEEKLQWMKDALPSLRAANIREGMLDVSAKGGPIYSPIRVREIQKADAESKTQDDAQDDVQNDAQDDDFKQDDPKPQTG